MFTDNDIKECINHLNWQKEHNNGYNASIYEIFSNVYSKRMNFNSPYKRGIDLLEIINQLRNKDKFTFINTIQQFTIQDFEQILLHLKFLFDNKRMSKANFDETSQLISNIYGQKRILDDDNNNNVDKTLRDIELNDGTKLSTKTTKKLQYELEKLEIEEQKLSKDLDAISTTRMADRTAAIKDLKKVQEQISKTKFQLNKN